MSKVRTYTQSTSAVEAQRAYARRQSKAKNHVWREVKSKHAALFRQLMNDFNAEIDGDQS